MRNLQEFAIALEMQMKLIPVDKRAELIAVAFGIVQQETIEASAAVARTAFGGHCAAIRILALAKERSAA